MGFQLGNVVLTYANGQRALSRITLGAGRGERVAVIGPSGAGKTSLLRLLGAALRPDDGSIEVLGQGPWRLSARALRRLRSRIGVVYQKPPLPGRQRAITAILAGRLGSWPWWKAIGSLLYPADIPGAEAQLARLDLADRLFERCDRLSGGQLQRVGVARVLYQQPELILADDNLQTVIAAAEEGRRVYANIRRFLLYALAGGSAEIAIMLAGPAIGLALPLLPAQILWINLLTHGLPGLALGSEPGDPDAMHHPPRPPDETVLGAG